MTTESVRTTLHQALRQLAHEAHHLAGGLPPSGAEHDFYLGVAAAAQDRLHPEARRGDDWLRRESPAFRDGYMKTALMIAHHAPAPPLHLRPPLPAGTR